MCVIVYYGRPFRLQYKPQCPRGTLKIGEQVKSTIIDLITGALR